MWALGLILRFAQSELKQRSSIELELRAMFETIAEIKVSSISHIEILRGEMQCEMLRQHEAILAREIQLQACKLARRRAIEAAVTALWRRKDRKATFTAFLTWRCVRV
jgi:hypothetical protein